VDEADGSFSDVRCRLVLSSDVRRCRDLPLTSVVLVLPSPSFDSPPPPPSGKTPTYRFKVSSPTSPKTWFLILAI
jgi:hypothetical protein